MTNVTNIFSQLNKNTGNFLIFSEYTNALAHSTMDPAYQVRPSRFVCMNLLELDNFKNGLIDVGDDPNYFIPRFFQNRFEAGIAGLKNDDESISPSQFSVAFITKLAEIMQGVDNVGNIFVYDGSIDSSSWKDGFADIILNIESGAQKKSYTRKSEIPSDLTQYLSGCGETNFTNPDGFISGWNNEEIPLDPTAEQTDSICYNNDESGSIYKNNSSIIDDTFDIKLHTDNYFIFNTILILFNIIDETNNIVYKDIPMGLYFTGNVVDGKILNPVTIYTNVDEAYGAGSGWSLRICTRFAPTPTGQIKIEDVALESLTNNVSISALLSASAETLKKIVNASEKLWVNSQSYKDLYNIFTNSKTNVPYIKEVNGVKYWFINGKSTGAIAEMRMATDEDIIQIIDE